MLRFPLIRYLPERTNFKFVSVAGVMGVISTLLIIASLVSMVTAGFRANPVDLYNEVDGSIGHKAAHVLSEGFNLGVDFKGGTLLELRSTQPIDLAQVREIIGGLDLGDVQVQSFGAETSALVRFEITEAGSDADITRARQALAEQAPDVAIERTESVSAQVSEELFSGGLMALGLAIVLMLVYIWFRFEWQFGVGAVLGLFHDVILTLGLFSMLRMEFTLTIIAALLTIIGYSVNDTIVIYDRIREDMGKYKGKPLPEVINIAVNDTLARTLLTSFVTALSLVGLLIFGVGEIWDFAMAMLVGIIVGTYSSVYIASPLTIWLDERAAARERSAKGRMKAKTAEG